MKNRKKRIFFGTAVFWLLFVLLFLQVQRVFGVSNFFSEHTEMMFNGYYEEPENTLDTVLIGNSHVYRYWQGAFAWKQHGLANLALSSSDMPCSVLKNMGIEALKTQSPKVLVFDCTAFAKDVTKENNKIYLLMQNMKFSSNYIDMMQNYFTFLHAGIRTRLRYCLPFFTFHSRWSELDTADFSQTMPSYLNSCYLEDFLTQTYKKGQHSYTEERTAIAPRAEQSLRDLLSWSESLDIPVLFVAAPLLVDAYELQMINYVCDVVREYDVHCVNFNSSEWFDSFQFDLKTDFMDKGHTGPKGSWKYTDVLGQYLIDNYDLPDHRGEETYASWDVRADAYMDLVQEALK